MTGALAKRYARALLAVASGQGRVEETAAELGRTAVWLADPELGGVLASPMLGAKARAELLASIATSLDLSALMRDFLAVLAEKGRIAEFGSIDKAFEATFGPRAKCRIVVLDSQRRAQEVWQLARQDAKPERIGDLAEQYSVDPTSRTLRGEVPPIQKYGGQPALERQVFALKPGELSGIVQIADRFMVILCEGYTEAPPVKFAEVRDELYDDIHEKKQRIEMSRHFSHLREVATIDNFLAGTSQSPTQPASGGSGQQPAARTAQQPAARMAQQGGAMPATNVQLPQSLEADVNQPRAGSRKAMPSGPGQPASSGVRPASLDAPVR